MYWQSVEVVLEVLDKQAAILTEVRILTLEVLVVVAAVAVVALLLVQPFYSQEPQPTQ
jgi:hypothetical protein